MLRPLSIIQITCKYDLIYYIRQIKHIWLYYDAFVMFPQCKMRFGVVFTILYDKIHHMFAKKKYDLGAMSMRDTTKRMDERQPKGSGICATRTWFDPWFDVFTHFTDGGRQYGSPINSLSVYGTARSLAQYLFNNICSKTWWLPMLCNSKFNNGDEAKKQNIFWMMLGPNIPFGIMYELWAQLQRKSCGAPKRMRINIYLV